MVQRYDTRPGKGADGYAVLSEAEAGAGTTEEVNTAYLLVLN